MRSPLPRAPHRLAAASAACARRPAGLVRVLALDDAGHRRARLLAGRDRLPHGHRRARARRPGLAGQPRGARHRRLRRAAMSDLDLLRAELVEGRMLPAVAYTSAEVLAWELRHVYAGTWTCLGRLDELLPTTGDRPATQRAVTVGDVAALLVDGEPLRMFANTCRHRGHELLADGASSPGGAWSAPTTRGPTTWPADCRRPRASATRVLRAGRPWSRRAAGQGLVRLGLRARHLDGRRRRVRGPPRRPGRDHRALRTRAAASSRTGTPTRSPPTGR